MASPQKHNGNTQVSNELFDEFIKVDLSANEWRVFLWILRKSYGFNQKETKYAKLSYICEDIKIAESSAKWAIKKLSERNMICNNKGQYSVQKDYEKWVTKVVQKELTHWPKRANPLAPEIVTKELTHWPPTANPLAPNSQPISFAYKELKTTLKTTLKTSGFIPPTAQEVSDYGKTINFDIDGEQFVASYEKVGWVDKNGNKIKSWKACVVTWKKYKERLKTNTPKPQSQEEYMAEHNKKLQRYQEQLQ